MTRGRAFEEEMSGAISKVPTALRILIDDHRRIRRRLARFELQIERFARARRPDYEMLRNSIDFCGEFLQRCHHPREELLLGFLERRAPRVAAGYAGVTEGHAVLVRKAGGMAEALDAIARDAECSRDDLSAHGRNVVLEFRRHIDWEEAHLFPAASLALLARDWTELETRLVAA